MKYKVYYRKDPTFRFDYELTMKDVLNTEKFAFVKEIEAENMENAFYEMQGEVWSPNGEARELIMSLGLHHTSMSVGDVLINQNGTGFECDHQGWAPIPQS